MKLRNKLSFLLPLMLIANFGYSEVSFNGFASVVNGIDLNDEGAQSDYDSTSVNGVPETKLGLQLTGDLGDGVRLIGQAVAKGNTSTGFVPNYEWLYFDINVGQTDKLKIGRIRVPFYKYSDYLDVGYAYHWIAPPQSMYSLQFSNIDGVAYNRNGTIGAIESAITAVYGRYQGNFNVAGTAAKSELKNVAGLNWNMTLNSHEFYLGYFQAEISIDTSNTALDPLIGSQNPTSVVNALGLDASEFEWDGDFAYFVGAGYKGSFGDLEVFAEFSTNESKDAAQSVSSGGYAGIAYPIGDYSVHLSYGVRNFDEFESDAAAADLDLGLGDGSSLNSNLSAIANGSETEITVGVRKDIGAGAALKVELEQFVDSQVRSGAPGAEETDLTGMYLKVGIEAVF